jgi:hypothetical protein
MYLKTHLELSDISLVGWWRNEKCAAYVITFTLPMDALKAEIASKRKAVEESSLSRPTKYMRRGELERLREEQEQKARDIKKADEITRQTVAFKEQSNSDAVSLFFITLAYLVLIFGLEKSHPPVLHGRQNRRNQRNPHSIYPTRRRYVGFVPEVNPFDFLESPTRIGV